MHDAARRFHPTPPIVPPQLVADDDLHEAVDAERRAAAPRSASAAAASRWRRSSASRIVLARATCRGIRSIQHGNDAQAEELGSCLVAEHRGERALPCGRDRHREAGGALQERGRPLAEQGEVLRERASGLLDVRPACARASGRSPSSPRARRPTRRRSSPVRWSRKRTDSARSMPRTFTVVRPRQTGFRDVMRTRPPRETLRDTRLDLARRRARHRRRSQRPVDARAWCAPRRRRAPGSSCSCSGGLISAARRDERGVHRRLALAVDQEDGVVDAGVAVRVLDRELGLRRCRRARRAAPRLAWRARRRSRRADRRARPGSGWSTRGRSRSRAAVAPLNGSPAGRRRSVSSGGFWVSCSTCFRMPFAMSVNASLWLTQLVAGARPAASWPACRRARPPSRRRRG